MTNRSLRSCFCSSFQVVPPEASSNQPQWLITGVNETTAITKRSLPLTSKRLCFGGFSNEHCEKELSLSTWNWWWIIIDVNYNSLEISITHRACPANSSRNFLFSCSLLAANQPNSFLRASKWSQMHLASFSCMQLTVWESQIETLKFPNTFTKTAHANPTDWARSHCSWTGSPASRTGPFFYSESLA